jgi:hypothetical protein
MNVKNIDKTIKGMHPDGATTYLTKSDTTEIPMGYRGGVYVVDGAGKTLKVTFVDGTVYTFTATELADNDTLDIGVKLIWATGSTVTKIKCLKREL